MRVLLLNLPHATRAQRRYRCSYRAHNFLFPPLELLSIGGVLKEAGDFDTRLVDAIAGGWDTSRTAAAARDYAPQAIVAMPGFEILLDDLEALKAIKEATPDSRTVLFGYLPGLFPEQLLEAGGVDAIMCGEPESVIAECLSSLAGGGSEHIWRGDVIADLDGLPPPDYSIANIRDYGDFMFPKPFAALQTSRGCPYPCNYCVRPYGRKVVYRSAERTVEDARRLVADYGVRGLRFEDDTFPLDRERAVAISAGLADLNMAWSCLARPDTVDETLAREFYRGGCRRVYLGIESGSDRVLEKLGRNHTARRGLEAAVALKGAGIEVAGFFLVGTPGETERDVEESLRLARSARLDYVGVSTLVPYPGTEVFESGELPVTFNLLPFESHFADPQIREIGRRREKAFYLNYYFRPGYIIRRLNKLARHPVESLRGGAAMSLHLARRAEDGKHGDLI